jgi:phosphatidylglycerophosphatase A
VATGIGSGFSPIAPGTAGSALGLLLFWPLSQIGLGLQLAATAVVTVVGVAAADAVATRVGKKDPGIVVVDEIAGMWVSLLLLPMTPATAVLAFLCFRLMDILKPFPARDLERLPGGIGIMADDLAAGLYANLLVRLVLLVWPLG